MHIVNMAKRKEKSKKSTGEVLMRVPVGIISGVILYVWGIFIFCFAIVQLILILVKDKKEEELLKICDRYVIQINIFLKYITFIEDKRPFPFADL